MLAAASCAVRNEGSASEILADAFSGFQLIRCEYPMGTEVDREGCIDSAGGVNVGPGRQSYFISSNGRIDSFAGIHESMNSAVCEDLWPDQRYNPDPSYFERIGAFECAGVPLVINVRDIFGADVYSLQVFEFSAPLRTMRPSYEMILVPPASPPQASR